MAEKIELASVSYTLGILSIVLAFSTTYGLGGLISGIIGLVIAHKNGYKRAKRLNVIGLVLSTIILIFNIVAIISLANSGSFPIS